MKRSKFSLSHHKLLTCEMGELVPCGLVEVLPGDSIQHATSALVRVSPLNAPVMHPVDVRIHHWYIPLRTIWEDFEDFITGGPDGMDATSFPVHTSAGGWAVGSLGDYLGIPTGVAGVTASALPMRAYASVYNEFYRDQDLMTELAINKGSGADATTNVDLKKVAWEKDYFTTSRPWSQKGPAVTLPLGVDAPVVTTNADVLIKRSGGTDRNLLLSSDVANPITYSGATEANQNLRFGSVTGLKVDLTGATAQDIIAFREAMALQRYEENRARYGSRYTEYLRLLGIKSSDARLQRPEYLGGGKETIQFSEVLQTGAPLLEEEDQVGDMFGHGIAALRSNRYRRFFEEHGYILSLMSVLPKTIYMQGLPRHFNRRTKEDYFQRELQHIGQQEVLNKEVYAAHASPDGIFGYQDRYDEYRRMESSVHGEFRSSFLDFWHMARIFTSSPALNSDFVTSNPTKRIHHSQEEDALWIMAKHSIQARRIVDANATPRVF